MRSILYLSFFATVAVALPTLSQWHALNQTVKGRLHGGVPIAAPCYSNYNGTAQTVDSDACSDVQDGYTTDSYIVSQYSGFTNVNWGTCQSVGQGCPLNFADPSDPTVTLAQECYQGAVSPYYIAAVRISFHLPIFLCSSISSF